MEYFYAWIKNIIIFLILTTIISNLLGKSSYKKYINLISGIILLILVITPVLKIFSLTDSIDYYFSANFLLAETMDISNKFIAMEEEQTDMIMKEYKDNLIEQIESILAKENLYIHNIHLYIDEENNSPTFGQIVGMDLVLSYIRNNVEEETVEKIVIEKIKIKGSEVEIPNGKKSSSEGKILSPDEINAKKRLSDFYNINPDNINISIQE